MKKRNIFVIFAISVLVLSSCRESSDDVFNPASALNNSYSSYAGQFNTIWNGLDQGYVFFEEGKKQGKADWGTIYSTYMPQFSALDRQMKELPDDVFEAYRTSETSSPIWEMAVGLYKSIANNLIDHHFSMDIHDPYSSKYTTGTIFTISPGNTEVKSRAYYHQTNSEDLIALTTTTTDYSGFTVSVSDYVASVTSSDYCVSCVFKDGDGNAIPYLLLDLFRVYDICLNYSSAPEDYVVLSNFWESIKNAYDSKSLAGVILDVRGNHGGYTVDTEFLIGMYLNDSYIFTPARTKFKNGPGHYDFTPWVSYSLVSADKDSNLSLSSEVLQDIRSNKVDLVSANVPYVVLCDVNSASMAEISSAYTKALPNGYVIGERTIGASGPLAPSKNAFEIFNSGIFGDPDLITTHHYVYTSTFNAQMKDENGDFYCFEGVGIQPDKEVLFNDYGLDGQLNEAVKLIDSRKNLINWE